MRIRQQAKLLFRISTILALMSYAAPVLAQSSAGTGGQSRAPRRPSVSPYLNLGIENSGALPSYQAFVLPRVEQQKQITAQYMMQGRAAKIEDLVDPNLRQTGLGGRYQNYSHFYPAQNSRQRPK